MKKPAILLLALFLSGCAAARRRALPPENPYWHDCQETTPAKSDGFQHFTCTRSADGRQFEVIVKPRG